VTALSLGRTPNCPSVRAHILGAFRIGELEPGQLRNDDVATAYRT
jgi:hypothetical protein